MDAQWATRRPVRVEFVEFTGDNGSEICSWVRGRGTQAYLQSDSDGPYIIIEGQPGRARRGDFMIRDPRATGGRRFYHMQRDIFVTVYDQDGAEAR